MKAFFALVAREISERKALLAAAAVASLIPVVAPLLPTTGSNPAGDIREVVMWFMIWGLIPLFSLLLGANFIGRDLSEGRLGFYFAQPISGPTIWFGKLTAVVLLIWGAQLVLMLPTALLSGDAARILVAAGLFLEPVGDWASSVTVWLGPVAVILVSHALGLVWRARSAWVVLDIIAIALLVVSVRFVIHPFLQIFAFQVVMAIYGWMSASVLIGLLIAGQVQLAQGRVDARRGHRALSLTLWFSLGVAVVVAAGWGLWVRSANPGDLERVLEISVGSGDWIAVTGTSDGRLDYHPGFIINTANGRWIPAHSGSTVHKRVVEFSADMSRAVWTAPYGFKETKLMAVDLTGESLRPEWTGVVMNRYWGDMVVSPNGQRVAVVQGGSVTVYAVDSGDLLVAANVKDGFEPYRIHFLGEDQVTILAGKRIQVSDDPPRHRFQWKRHRLNIETRSLDGGEEIESSWQWWGGSLDNPVRNRLVEREVEGEEDRLILVESGDEGAETDLGEMPTRWSDVRVMADHQIVIRREQDQRIFLELFASTGRPVRKVDLVEAGWVQIGGEFLRNRLAVGQIIWDAESGEPAERRTVLVDLSTGGVGESIDGVTPVLGRWGLTTSPGAWEAGSVATRLMEGKNYSLHLWDPETGELKQLIPVPD